MMCDTCVCFSIDTPVVWRMETVHKMQGRFVSDVCTIHARVNVGFNSSNYGYNVMCRRRKMSYTRKRCRWRSWDLACDSRREKRLERGTQCYRTLYFSYRLQRSSVNIKFIIITNGDVPKSVFVFVLIHSYKDIKQVSKQASKQASKNATNRFAPAVAVVTSSTPYLRQDGL
jgi:hypothetical protein